MKVTEKIIKKSVDRREAPVTFAFLGDSVTQGCFELYKTSDRSFQTEFRIEDGYHTKLRDILQTLYPTVPINMIYAGISGDTAADGLKRLNEDVLIHKPDLTIICFGLNDCCTSDLDTYKKSLSEILKRVKECGSEIIFMTPNLMADSVSPEVSDAYMKEAYENIIKSAEKDNSLEEFVEAAKIICAEENVPVCDCYKIWSTLKEKKVDTTRLLSNRINHPTAKMHWLFAFKLAEMIILD